MRDAEVEFQSQVNPLTKIFVDPEQFKRVFVNIFKNSLQAIQQGGVTKGKITVQSSENSSESGSGNSSENKLGNKVENKSENKSENKNGLVEIMVSDNGPGIPHETLQRLFEPFFTTKEKGAGLGLAIVQKIISDHGASIDIKSQKGELTTVIIRVQGCLNRSWR